MSTTSTTLACRMLAAADAAYLIQPDGSFTPPTGDPIYNAVGWTTAPTPIVGVSGIDKQELNACLVGTTGDGVVVAFRGTLPLSDTPKFEVEMDWLQDFLMPPYDDDPTIQSWGTGVMVHPGFWDALSSLTAKLDPLLASLKPASGAFYFTGHSKGGPMATLGAMRYAGLNPTAPPPAVYTFASPRPGNAAFATAFAQKNLVQTRYENDLDLIPLMPPTPDDVSNELDPALQLANQLGKLDTVWYNVLTALLNNTVAAWNYQPVGTGFFIDDDGTVGPIDSQTQWADIFDAMMQGDYASIGAAHCPFCASTTPPTCQGGYMTGVCGSQSGICS